jgi:hypothetical protein
MGRAGLEAPGPFLSGQLGWTDVSGRRHESTVGNHAVVVPVGDRDRRFDAGEASELGDSRVSPTR